MQDHEEVYMLLGQLFHENFKLRKLAALLKNQTKPQKMNRDNGLSDEGNSDSEDSVRS